MKDFDDLQRTVKRRYGAAAKATLASEPTSCCGSNPCSDGTADPITRDLYASTETADLPANAVQASFGCGNPTALAQLEPGETVLDLGSGGGLDVLLSARRVGPTGKAFGLDMTREMLELARANQAKAGVTNAEFLEGTIESIPLPDRSVDVVISNCVINLSGDKRKTIEEAFRVLRRGGRLAVADIVLRRELPPAVRASMELWTGCVAGALLEREYKAELERAGFVDVDVHATRVFDRDDVRAMARAAAEPAVEAAVDSMDGAVVSAFIRARKP